MRLTERLPRETGRDYALRTIKDNIVRLELTPGSMVSENELAAEMGLSRTPVREALIELSKAKIVEIYPQRGSSISLIDYNLVEEARFMRQVLECAVIERCCGQSDAMQMQRLQENLRLQQFYQRDGGTYTEMLMELDNAFHGLLFEMAGKPQVYKLMENMSLHADRVRSLALSKVKDEKIVQDHELLVQTILENQPEEAVRLMKKHLNRYNIDAKAIREAYPTYFK